MLNVLPLPHQRHEVCLALRALLEPRGGQALVAVWRKGEEDTASPAGVQVSLEPDEWQAHLGAYFDADPIEAPFLAWRCRPRKG